MRGAKQPFVSPPPPPPPSPPQPLRDIETAYSKVSRRDAQWMISPLGHIYYPNLGTVRARLCGLHSPQIARPTAPVFLRMQIERSRTIRQPSHLTPHHTTPHHTVSSFSSLFRFPRRIRYATAVGGLITIITAVTRAAARDGMHRSDYFQEECEAV